MLRNTQEIFRRMAGYLQGRHTCGRPGHVEGSGLQGKVEKMDHGNHPGLETGQRMWQKVKGGYMPKKC